MTERVDVVVVGAGLVGLATAHALLQARPKLAVLVIDKEARVGAHQSSHNSGVLHAGLYYQPGSLKARLARAGKIAMEDFASENGIPIDRCGKVVVAVDTSEESRFEALKQRALANGTPGIEEIDLGRLAELEPNVLGVRALYSPTTGIIDFEQVARVLQDRVTEAGGRVVLGSPVTGIRRRPEAVIVRTATDEIVSSWVVACAGLHADRVARSAGDDPGLRIIPFRGDYYTLAPRAKHLIRNLVYPVPDPSLPFLGVHFTRRIDGEVWAGPNAVLAFAREGYRRRDVRLRDLAETASYPGFLRLVGRFWSVGLAEFYRDWVKAAFLRELQRYVPALTADDLVWGPSGVRAQAVSRNGELVDDFRLQMVDRVLHVLNAPSPAATASLAIGQEIASRLIDRLDAA